MPRCARALSPDGRWLLYQSDQSGRLEVYLRPFPDVGSARWPVSTAGGTSAAWGMDGTELFFVDGTTLQAVTFAPGPPPRLGRPRPLLDLGPSEDRLGSEFDIAPDGSRVLVMRDAPGSAERAEVRLILNWAAHAMTGDTELLAAHRGGDAGAFERMIPIVYADLRWLARAQLRRMRPGSTVDTTALVHEAYPQAGRSGPHAVFQDRGHFLAVSASGTPACRVAMYCAGWDG